MSEYQYYEFLAIDRPLDDQQQAEVRALSTRADITATSFTSEYHGGDFRGDPGKMMELYYDAHLYFANWGTRQLMLRLPRTQLSFEVAEQYCIDPNVVAWASGEHVILDLTSEDADEDGHADGHQDAQDTLPPSPASAPNSPPATCAPSTWPGWRPTASGSATKTRSTTRMKKSSSHRSRPA